MNKRNIFLVICVSVCCALAFGGYTYNQKITKEKQERIIEENRLKEEDEAKTDAPKKKKKCKKSLPILLCCAKLIKRFYERIKEERKMKEKIHPAYMDCKVTCACGNTFMTKSNKPEIRLDVCSECHPFFTGQQKFINRGGRVEQFKQKYGIK